MYIENELAQETYCRVSSAVMVLNPTYIDLSCKKNQFCIEAVNEATKEKEVFLIDNLSNLEIAEIQEKFILQPLPETIVCSAEYLLDANISRFEIENFETCARVQFLRNYLPDAVDRTTTKCYMDKCPTLKENKNEY